MYLKINTAGNTTSALLLDLFVWPQAVSYLLIKMIAVFWNFTVFPHKKSTPWRVRKIKLLYLILSLFFFSPPHKHKSQGQKEQERALKMCSMYIFLEKTKSMLKEWYGF